MGGPRRALIQQVQEPRASWWSRLPKIIFTASSKMRTIANVSSSGTQAPSDTRIEQEPFHRISHQRDDQRPDQEPQPKISAHSFKDRVANIRTEHVEAGRERS